MGLIGRLVGAPGGAMAIGRAAAEVAEVFTPNATRAMEASHDAYMAALDEYGAEFQYAMPGLFDRFVNGLNRLPRPFLAFGTLGLFVYAMVAPEEFSRRMIGLNHVPDPLWWLLTAIVGFYFGAREAHYFRMKPTRGGDRPPKAPYPEPRGRDDNPALNELRRGRDR